MQIVVFRLGNENFAVDTSKVQSINDMMSITKVPKALPHIKGLINLRGSIKSLIDVNLLLQVASNNEPENIIILTVKEEEIGITVDEVQEVLDIEEKDIQSIEDKENYIVGVIHHEDKLLTIIDIDKLLNLE